ncbi:MAG: VWA domain-containing protein, partial [Gemmatimonadota bacterium]
MRGTFVAVEKILFFGIISLILMSLLGHTTAHAVDTYLVPEKSVTPSEIWKKTCEQTPQEATLTLTLTGAGDCPSGNLDIMLIIDRSSTMLTDSRIDSAKAAARAFIDQLRDQDRAGLVTFGGDATLDKGLTPMTPAGKADLKAAIDTIVAYGWTNIGDAIRTANHELEDIGRPGVGWVQILLSDGIPNRPLGLPNPPGPVGYSIMAADTARMLGIPIYTIGLALTIPEGIQLLQTIADTTGAIYYDSPTPDELRDIYLDIAGVIICDAATDIVVTDVLQSYINIENAFTVSPNSISTDPITQEKTIVWNVPDIDVASSWVVSFKISSNVAGKDLPVDVYGDSKVEYTRDGETADTLFPQATIDVFECLQPTLVVTKTDALFSDEDSNGVISPGDVILYTIVITNNGAGIATGVTFADTPDVNSDLVVGSVTTSQGTVTDGNFGGDTTVGVTIGSVPTMNMVTITFRVTIDDPFPLGLTEIANQGWVNSNQVSDKPTDDPDTPAPDDPTVTPVVAGPIIEADKTDTDLNGGNLEPGETLEYTVTISNSGNQNAVGLRFTDA